MIPSSLSPPLGSRPSFVLLFAVAAVSNIDALLSPLLPPMRPSSRTTASLANTNLIVSNNPVNGMICNGISRRVRCNHEGGGITSSATPTRVGLPLSATSSSSEEDDQHNTPKSKAKAKTKRKSKVKSGTTAKTKTQSKRTAKPKASSKRKAPTAENSNTDAGVPGVTFSGTVSGQSAPDLSPPDVAVTKSQTESNSAPSLVAKVNTNSDGIFMGPQVSTPDMLDFDITGGRPGSIIESEEELERRKEIMDALELNDPKKTGRIKYPKWLKSDYGFLEEELLAVYDNDDPDAIDAATIGRYDITDLRTKFDHEWDPTTELDPNLIETQIKTDIFPTGKYLEETEKDEDGVEVGYDPIFGHSNPIDERTKVGTIDSYMVDVNTRDENMLTPEFHPDDPEITFNEDVVQYRRSMDIIETYQDEFLPPSLPVPRNVAKWYGYPEPQMFEKKNYTNNRFTPLDKLTNFDDLGPHRARKRAVELARSNNAEWMADGVSQAWHQKQRQPYEVQETLVGTLRKGDCDPDIVEMIKPALQILGLSAELLSIEGEDGTVFRFHYHGLMKNKFGMSCWTETLIRDCGVDVTGVVFETGFRARDPAYDGGFPFHGWE